MLLPSVPGWGTGPQARHPVLTVWKGQRHLTMVGISEGCAHHPATRCPLVLPLGAQSHGLRAHGLMGASGGWAPGQGQVGSQRLACGMGGEGAEGAP